MFDLEIMVVSDDAAKRSTKRTATKSRKRSGRGAPGRPKSAAHRKAISAGLSRYWRSKRAAHRRRKGNRKSTSTGSRKRRSSGGRKSAKKSTAKRSRGWTLKGARKRFRAAAKRNR